MATGDKKLSELPVATEVVEANLMLLEQEGTAKQMSGGQFLAFVRPLIFAAAQELVASLPKTASIEVDWANNLVTETLDNGTVLTYDIEKDNNGVPTKIGDITLSISGVVL